MMYDRRRRNWDGRDQIVAPDQRGSEPRLCLGPKRYVLRLQGTNRWIAADFNRLDEGPGRMFTETKAEALHFSTRNEAFALWRRVSPLWPIDDDGKLYRPIADFDLGLTSATGNSGHLRRSPICTSTCFPLGR